MTVNSTTLATLKKGKWTNERTNKGATWKGFTETERENSGHVEYRVHSQAVGKTSSSSSRNPLQNYTVQATISVERTMRIHTLSLGEPLRTIRNLLVDSLGIPHTKDKLHIWKAQQIVFFLGIISKGAGFRHRNLKSVQVSNADKISNQWSQEKRLKDTVMGETLHYC